MLVSAIRKDTESLALGLAAGADDYLEAPFDPGRLVAKVARIIERKRTDEPLAILASDERNALVQAMFRRGVLVLGAGKNALRLAPPLVLSKEQADSVLGILDQSLTEVAGAR